MDNKKSKTDSPVERVDYNYPGERWAKTKAIWMGWGLKMG